MHPWCSTGDAPLWRFHLHSSVYHQLELQEGERANTATFPPDSMVLLALQPSLALRHDVSCSACGHLYTNVCRMWNELHASKFAACPMLTWGIRPVQSS